MASLPDPTATLTGEDRKIYERMLAQRQAQGTGLYGPYVALMNHPRLAERIEQLGYYYKFQATLPRYVYQFVVLSFAKTSGIKFEWLDHVAAARKAGLPEAVIEMLASGGEALPAPYADVAQCMACALKYQSIPQALQDRIVKAFGLTGLIEIVTLCGFYAMIGMVNTCFDVALPQPAGAPTPRRD